MSLFFFQSGAQLNSKFQPAALGIHVGFNDFKNIEGNSNFQGFSNLKPAIAISYLSGVSHKCDIIGMIAGSMVNFTNKRGGNYGMGDNKLLLEVDVAVRAKLRTYPAILNPFIDAGIGGSIYDNHYGAFIPFGVGLQVKVNARAFVLLNAQYRMPLTQTEDHHFFYSAGVAGNIGKAKATKKKARQAIQMPSSGTLPPRDIDGDGILDSLDRCPIVPGFSKYNGCPIPDTDGDGINDENDSCTTVAGMLKYHGCPVPDRDLDKVNDEEDLCPDTVGLISNHGCPLMTDTLTKQVNTAAQNIFFITGSYHLSPASYPALDDVVRILYQHPVLKMDIEGHTDNIGSETANQLLSENRAMAVLDYLVRKGIDKERLHSTGYGASLPIGDNATKVGRSQNRRVVLIIKKGK
ncbi:MAG: OmpA family protein [Ferruginibacter sp.]